MTTSQTVPGMCWIPPGEFAMGSDRFYPEEAPRRRVRVDGFWIDEAPVTNRAFAAFVEATGHVTQAEIAPDPHIYPGLLPGMDQPGSLVFRKPAGPVPMSDYGNWWEFTIGADWRHPLGPASGLDDLWDHPVVHVAHADALAYASWCNKTLPSEAEFEFAARGGLVDQDYAWGGELAPGGQMMANYWQGLFPFANTREDGWERTSPVRYFPPNAYGVYDLIGNVWEWTQDWWSEPQPARKSAKAAGGCCTVSNPRGGSLAQSYDPTVPAPRIGRKVVKGGSHLCAVNYCQRYRPAARQPEMIDTSTSHIGFRCALRPQGNGS